MPAVGFLLLFLNDFFPGLLPKAVRWFVYGASALYALMILLLDSQVYTFFLLPHQSIQAVAILYIAVRVVMKQKNLSADRQISAGGMFVFFFGVLYDIVLFNGIVQRAPGTGLSQVAMIVCACANGCPVCAHRQ